MKAPISCMTSHHTKVWGPHQGPCTPTIIVTWRDSHLIKHGKSHSNIWNVIYIVYTTNRISPMHSNDRRVTQQQHNGKKFKLGLKHSYIHMNNWTCCFATFSILPIKTFKHQPKQHMKGGDHIVCALNNFQVLRSKQGKHFQSLCREKITKLTLPPKWT